MIRQETYDAYVAELKAKKSSLFFQNNKEMKLIKLTETVTNKKEVKIPVTKK